MPPPAVPFRDRPVLERIVEQHAEEAAFLWTLRDAATDSPAYARRALALLDDRVEAHLDGLRVAGEAGWRIARERLKARPDAGELFAAGVLALEGRDAGRIGAVVGAASEAPGAAPGFEGALGWCASNRIGPAVRSWRVSSDGFERQLALFACSLHRVGPGPGLAACLDDPDPRPRASALRLAGELGKLEHLGACVRRLDDPDPVAAFWAARSAVLLGERCDAPGALRAATIRLPDERLTRARAEAAIELATRAGGPGQDAADGRRAAVSLGHLGDPAAVPWLLDRMADPALARAAGEAFAAITGADLTGDRLEGPRPEGVPEALGDDAADEAVGPDPDEDAAWPDPGAVRRWWDGNAGRFARGTRHLAGRPIGGAACEIAWASGTQPRRRAAAFELALAAPGAPLRDWAAPLAGPRCATG